VPDRPSSTNASRAKADVLKRLGTHLRRLRLERRLTQEDLSKRSGLSYKYIGRVELGKADPGAIVLVQWARALNTTVGELFEPITPVETAGYRVSPADVESANGALSLLSAIVDRVTAGQGPTLPKRTTRKRRS
jgi:transcriptional regulator with XRE-family HTH domain